MMGGGWLIVGLLVVLIVVALAVGQRAGADQPGRTHAILRERFAAGDMDPDDDRQRAEQLGPDRGDRSMLRRRFPAVLAVMVGLALVGLLFSGPGRPWGGWWGPMDGHLRGGHMDGMWGQRTGQGDAPDPVEDADGIVVEANEMAFDPDGFEVTAGEPVNVTVNNVGQVFHDLTIDELGLQIGVDSGQSTTAGLDIDEPGEYIYYCSVSGHASAGMQGTLTVLAP